MVTRAEQREATQRRIVEAAIDAFSEQGFHGASTRDIARRARSNQGLITYYFKSKDKLWRAAADQLFESLHMQLKENAARQRVNDPQVAAREAIKQFVRFAADNPQLVGLMIAEGRAPSERLDWLVDTHLRRLYHPLARIGSLRARADLMPHAYYVVAGAASLIFALAPECERLTGRDPRSREAIERHADYVASLLVP